LKETNNVDKTWWIRVLIIAVYKCWTIYTRLYSMCYARFCYKILIITFHASTTIILSHKFNFIKFLLIIKKKNIYIFYVIDYFIRFFMTFFIKIVNAENVIKSFEQVFAKYTKSLIIYCDREQHFKNFKIKSFLIKLKISLIFNSFQSSQSLEMIKVKNKLLKNIFRKIHEDWESILLKIIHNLNVKMIHH
jgi:hypothetical protein